MFRSARDGPKHSIFSGACVFSVHFWSRSGSALVLFVALVLTGQLLLSEAQAQSCTTVVGNVVLNCSFDSGTSPWQSTGDVDLNQNTSTHSGVSDAAFRVNTRTPGTATIFQSLTNLSIGTYVLTYYAAPVTQNGANPVGSTSVQAALGGQTGASHSFTSFNGLSSAVYTSYQDTFTVAVAGAANLTFTYVLTSCSTSLCALLLDDVSLVFQTATNTSLSANLPSSAPSNARNVTGAIDAFSNAGGALPAGFTTLGTLSGAQLQAAALQMSGQPGASAAQAGVTSTTQFINSMFDAAFDNATSAGFGLGYAAEDDEALGYKATTRRSKEATEAYAAVTPRDRLLAAYTPAWNVWGSVYGGNSRTSGDAALGSNTTNSRVWGMLAGADYKVTPNTRLGFALGGGG